MNELGYWLIAYIALSNTVAAAITWMIFGELGWGKVAKCLCIGFIASAIAWGAFTGGSTEEWFYIESTHRTVLVLAGLGIKAVGMTIILVGLFFMYRLAKRLRITRHPETGQFQAASDPTVSAGSEGDMP